MGCDNTSRQDYGGTSEHDYDARANRTLFCIMDAPGCYDSSRYAPDVVASGLSAKEAKAKLVELGKRYRVYFDSTTPETARFNPFDNAQERMDEIIRICYPSPAK